MSAATATDETFETQVLKADGPVMVDFWAEWCGPCKAMAPAVDQLADEMSDQLKVVKVNVEEAPNAPTQYGVRGIPTVMIFKEGELVDTQVGGMSKDQLQEWVQSHI